MGHEDEEGPRCSPRARACARPRLRAVEYAPPRPGRGHGHAARTVSPVLSCPVLCDPSQACLPPWPSTVDYWCTVLEHSTGALGGARWEVLGGEGRAPPRLLGTRCLVAAGGGRAAGARALRRARTIVDLHVLLVVAHHEAPAGPRERVHLQGRGQINRATGAQAPQRSAELADSAIQPRAAVNEDCQTAPSANGFVWLCSVWACTTRRWQRPHGATILEFAVVK